MWWASHHWAGRSQLGKAQPPSRTTSARRSDPRMSRVRRDIHNGNVRGVSTTNVWLSQSQAICASWLGASRSRSSRRAMPVAAGLVAAVGSPNAAVPVSPGGGCRGVSGWVSGSNAVCGTVTTSRGFSPPLSGRAPPATERRTNSTRASAMRSP